MNTLLCQHQSHNYSSMIKFFIATLSILTLPAVNITTVNASNLKTKCTLEIASGDKFIFPCSLTYDSSFKMGVIKDLNSGKVYGKGWAEGRGCSYKEGYGSICTHGYKWILPDGQTL